MMKSALLFALALTAVSAGPGLTDQCPDAGTTFEQIQVESSALGLGSFTMLQGSTPAFVGGVPVDYYRTLDENAQRYRLAICTVTFGGDQLQLWTFTEESDAWDPCQSVVARSIVSGISSAADVVDWRVLMPDGSRSVVTNSASFRVLGGVSCVSAGSAGSSFTGVSGKSTSPFADEDYNGDLADPLNRHVLTTEHAMALCQSQTSPPCRSLSFNLPRADEVTDLGNGEFSFAIENNVIVVFNTETASAGLSTNLPNWYTINNPDALKRKSITWADSAPATAKRVISHTQTTTTTSSSQSALSVFAVGMVGVVAGAGVVLAVLRRSRQSSLASADTTIVNV